MSTQTKARPLSTFTTNILSRSFALCFEPFEQTLHAPTLADASQLMVPIGGLQELCQDALILAEQRRREDESRRKAAEAERARFAAD